ncbi:MAG: TspO/MBR family protein [Candidatus Woesearchaeota archaeon]
MKKKTERLGWTVRLAISLAIPLLVGLLGSLMTSSSLKSWYLSINKPSFNPPNWVFAPVWIALFIMMGISFYLLWERNELSRIALAAYFGQLALNLMWSFLFFGLRKPAIALIDIFALWIMIVINIFVFRKSSKTAALLLVPYLLWVSFALILNYFIVLLN